MLATQDVLERFGGDPDDARANYNAFVTGEDPAEDNAVRRSAEGPHRERPPLAELLESGDEIAAIRTAHFQWDYTVRAIADLLGLSPATISRRMKSSG